MATGDSVECGACPGGKTRLKVHECAVHGFCVQGRSPVQTLAGCDGCPSRRSRPVLQVRANSNGIGDNLLALAVSAALQRGYPGCEVVVATQTRFHPWLRCFNGYDRLIGEPLKAPTCFCDNHGDWDAFRTRGIPRWEFWAEKFGLPVVLPEPVPVPPAAADWAIPCHGAIALAPFASFPERTWPVGRWLEVERRLRELGFATFILDDHLERCAGFASGGKFKESPARVTAAVRAAAVLVGNDSGLAHVAGMSGTPAVAVCAAASDRNIFGLYPSVTSLEGLHAVQPADVVRAALVHVRRSVDPAFPLERFLDVLHPNDHWRREHWPPVYATLWKTVKRLAPRTVVEIGTRTGGSAWTILDASPGCTIHTIDLPQPGEGGVPWGPAHARQLLAGRRATFHTADSHVLERLPLVEPDLCYVDGDHNEEAAFSDLCLAERSGAKAVLVDDFVSHPTVRAACARFLATRPHLRGEFIPSQTGLFLIRPGDPPDFPPAAPHG